MNSNLLPEHTVVRFLKDTMVDGNVIPGGAYGTIVSVYSDAYAVEWSTSGQSDVVTVRCDQVAKAE